MAQAATPNSSRAGGIDEGFDFTPAMTPGSLDPNRRVTLMIEMTGDPVTVTQSKAPGKVLAEADKTQIRSDLAARQEDLKPSLAATGATVVGQFQDAYNGVKVVASASAASALAALPGVKAVHPVAVHTLDNSVSVPYIGAPAAWTSTHFHGEGVKVAVIDTGIDYTHANFGGPGTTAAYNAALATDTAPANPAWFGPGAPKVKGGIDLVGDNYDAAADPKKHPEKLIPHPDPNPLDCAGHGSHVAGTVAGFGVTGAGATYTGGYDSSIYQPGAFTIGPGVAPKADLYAVRVFGCTGSTNVVVEALDWSVKNGMQVVNMSLGSTYGNPADPDVTATNNAVAAGVIVVASAGNSGASPYIVGSPSIATGAISVAATDSAATFPGATVQTASGPVTAINANAATIPAGSFPVTYLRTASGGPSLGCVAADYENPAQPVAGHVVVTQRGTCDRVFRAQLGYSHHAVAVIMVNNAVGLPPYEGQIPGVPSTMPFLGVSSADKVAVRTTPTVSMTAVALANPAFRKIADFSSGGPTRLTSALKPDITAPGVSVFSTAVGTGTKGVYFSGTSMAAPHVSGVAALTIQAHPTWATKDIRAAIVNTGDPSQVKGYVSPSAGTGLVQPNSAVHTSVTVETDLANPIRTAKPGTSITTDTNISFPFAELTQDFADNAQFNVLNHGASTAAFAVSVEQGSVAAGSSPHTATVDNSTITIGAGETANLQLNLSVPAATAGNSDGFRQVRGSVVLTPQGGSNGGVTLRLPYSLVLRPRSAVATQLTGDFSPSSPNSTVSITNDGGTIPGSADFYAWGLAGNNSALGPIGLRGVGYQAFPGTGVFAINTFSRWSTPNTYEFDIAIDTRGGHTANFVLVAADHGVITTGSFDGLMAVALFNLTTGKARIVSVATAPTDGSTIELAFDPASIGLTTAQPRFSYSVASFDNRDSAASDQSLGWTAVNGLSPAISTGQFDVVAPGATVNDTVSLNSEWATTPALGLMVVNIDNESGARQADLIPVN